MPLNIPAGWANVQFVFALTGDPEEMVFGLAIANAGGTLLADLETAIEETDTRFRENFIPTSASMYDGWTYRGVRGELNASDAGPATFESLGTPISGSTAGETPAVNTTLLIKKLTGVAGRANRGRMYLPPFGVLESQISKQGVLTTLFQTAHQAAWDGFWADLDSDGVIPAVLHTNVLASPTPITSFSVSPLVATQRRRLRR